jgi:hypothetical protein
MHASRILLCRILLPLPPRRHLGARRPDLVL